MLRAWTTAWSAQTTQTYLRLYSKDFKTTPGQPRRTWDAQRKCMLAAKQQIGVDIEAPVIQDHENETSATFRHHYYSNAHRETRSKTLLSRTYDGKWRIVEECSGA